MLNFAFLGVMSFAVGIASFVSVSSGISVFCVFSASGICVSFPLGVPSCLSKPGTSDDLALQGENTQNLQHP